MNTTRSISFLLAATILMWAAPASATTRYVDPAGGGTGLTPTSPKQPQYAINSATSGDTLVFAPGTYLAGTTYGLGMSVSGKQLTFVGGGIGATIIDQTAGLMSVNGGADVSISAMSLVNGAGSTGIQVRGSDLELFDSEMLNFLGTSAVLITDGSTGTFDNVTFDANATGVVVSDGSDIVVMGCRFTNHTTAGIFAAGTSSATQIAGSTFDANAIGVDFQSSYADTHGAVIGNQFTANGYGVAVVASTYSAELVIDGNLLAGSTMAAIWSGVAGSTNVIVGNEVVDGNYGIYLYQAGDQVYNNVLHHNSNIAIVAAGAMAQIAHNTITLNGRHGILAAAGDSSLVANNAVSENRRAGIRVTGSTTQVGFNNSMFNRPNYAGAFTGLGGNMSAPPRFVNPGADFHLLPTSPMIGAASAALGSVTTDFDGLPRTFPPDTGAYEF